MTDRFLSSSSAWAIVLAAILLAPAFVHAQAPATAAAKKAAKSNAWAASQLPNGQPDMQGYWTNLTFTPFERPAKYGTREFLTDDETAELFKQGVIHSYEFTFENPAGTPVYDATAFGLDAWQNGIRPNKRTSLIVDPPDGRIPPLTPEAQKARTAKKNTANARLDGPEDLTLGVRCLTYAMNGPPMVPSGYNSNYHILQQSGYVMIESEWNSEFRIIPLDGRPVLSHNIHRWHGDSRGHWEGNTLVVETANFRPGATFENANPQTLRITERFTRLDADTIEYKFTISDPTTWTKPWSGIIPLSRVKGPMFEYACSEGNDDVINLLEAAHATEKSGGGDAK
jgi:hypothetical protein